MKKAIDKIFLLLTGILTKYAFTEAVSLTANQCFRFRRVMKNKEDEILFSYGIDGSLVRFRGVHSCVIFEEVVKISSIIEPNRQLIDTIINHPIIDSRFGLIDDTVIVENNKLLESEFEQLLITLEDYICRYILPFFDRVSSLQVVNDEIIDVVPHMELHKYISGNLILKKLIIMKLCNNPKYDDFVQWMDVRCQESLLLINDPMHYRYVETYDQFKKLVSYLASGAYLDLVKE